MTYQRRSGEFSEQVQGWVTEGQHGILVAIADRLTERTGKQHRPIDALRWLLDRGSVISFAEGRRQSV